MNKLFFYVTGLLFAAVVFTGCNKDNDDEKEPDVYVAGSDGEVAKLWKNGILQNLAVKSEYASLAYSVYVADGNVYVVGFERNAQENEIAVLWKNGEALNLTDGTRDEYARSVYVSGNDVYVAGYGRSADNYYDIAKLWKNGVVQNLTDENGVNISAEAQSVYVSGSDVYVVGYVWSAQSNFYYVAKLWKNGVAQDLTDGSKNGFAYSVFVK